MYFLQDQSKASKHARQREIIPLQKQRVIETRKEHIRYGKEKLAIRCKEKYGETISAWKIQKVAEEKKLYFNPIKTAKYEEKDKGLLKRQRFSFKAALPFKWQDAKSGARQRQRV